MHAVRYLMETGNCSDLWHPQQKMVLIKNVWYWARRHSVLGIKSVTGLYKMNWWASYDPCTTNVWHMLRMTVLQDVAWRVVDVFHQILCLKIQHDAHSCDRQLIISNHFYHSQSTQHSELSHNYDYVRSQVHMSVTTIYQTTWHYIPDCLHYYFWQRRNIMDIATVYAHSQVFLHVPTSKYWTCYCWDTTISYLYQDKFIFG